MWGCSYVSGETVRAESENTQGLLKPNLETDIESLPVSSHGPGEVTWLKPKSRN